MPAAKHQDDDFLDEHDSLGLRIRRQPVRIRWVRLVFGLVALAIIASILRDPMASLIAYLTTPYDQTFFNSFEAEKEWIRDGAQISFGEEWWTGDPSDARLQDICDKTQKSESLPALWLAFSGKGKPLKIAASGVLKVGDPTAATPDNIVHIGSCTKAMTAVLIGRLVDQGKLKWEQTIADSFPELKDKIHSDYHSVTLEQLLQHRGKVPANASDWWINQRRPQIERRLSIIAANLQKEPSKVPKDGYLYSNLGYMIAGSMAERTTGKKWEELIEKELFKSLGLSLAGFGPPGQKGRVHQPWGHSQNKDGTWQAQQGDNAAALGPAGTVHLSIADWIRFAEVFFPDSPQKLVSKETLLKLMTPASSNGYAMGWGTTRWNDDIIELRHSGSNTMWYATIVVDRKNQLTFVAVTNGHREGIEAVLEKAIEEVRALK